MGSFERVDLLGRKHGRGLSSLGGIDQLDRDEIGFLNSERYNPRPRKSPESSYFHILKLYFPIIEFR